MAEYSAAARSNYFRVNDIDAFRKDLARHGLEVTGWEDACQGDLTLDTDENNEPQGSVALFAAGADHGTWPHIGDADEIAQRAQDMGVACNSYKGVPDELCDTCDEEEREHTDTRPYAESIEELVSAHLIDGDVAVFMEAGAEKMSFVGGVAVAVNSKGEVVSVGLSDIYDKAAGLGENITYAMC